MTSTEALVTGSRLFVGHPVSNDRDEFITIREASREFHLPWEPIPEDGSDPIAGMLFERFVAVCDTPTSQKHLMCRISDSAIVGYVGLSQIFMGHFCSARTRLAQCRETEAWAPCEVRLRSLQRRAAHAP